MDPKLKEAIKKTRIIMVGFAMWAYKSLNSMVEITTQPNQLNPDQPF